MGHKQLDEETRCVSRNRMRERWDLHFFGGKTSGRFWFHQKPLDGVMESIDLLQDVDDVYLNIGLWSCWFFKKEFPY